MVFDPLFVKEHKFCTLSANWDLVHYEGPEILETGAKFGLIRDFITCFGEL